MRCRSPTRCPALREIRKPRALRPGDRIALVAPASGFTIEELQAGCEELRALDFEPVYDMAIFERGMFTAGPPHVRAGVLTRAWDDPSIAAVLAVRGGYGSAELLPLLDPAGFAVSPKPFIGYSDNTSLMMWLTLSCGVVTFHGPMIDRRLAGGPSRYDRGTFLGALMHPAPLGRIPAPGLEALRPGEARGRLLGGTLTQLAASLGTPYAFDPPAGSILFLDEVGERPYRVHRLFTQLAQAGIIARAAAIVFNELPGCAEASGSPCGRDVAVELTREFSGPVLFGLPSGHTDGATLTLPMGVTARVVTGEKPGLIIEEGAVI
jgi:muramoyltetrapeptide carboxypeptidase